MTKKIIAFSLCMIAMNSLSLADDFRPGQDIPGYPDGNSQSTYSGPNLIQKIGNLFSRGEDKAKLHATGTRTTVPKMDINSKGCLSLSDGQDYYPLRDKSDAELIPQTWISIDPNSHVTFHLNGQGAQALLHSRGNGIPENEWPIVIHGPVSFCGSVDIQFQAFDNGFISRRSDGVEIGPNVYITGNQNVNIVSSQLENFDVEGSCTARVNHDDYEAHTPCIRLENDLRRNSHMRVYLKYTGNVTCRLVGLTIPDVKSDAIGSKGHPPMNCAQIEEISGANDLQQPQTYVRTNVTTISSGLVTTRDCTVLPQVSSSSSCDGPYYAPIRPTNVDVNYGLRTVVIQQPVIAQPVQQIQVPAQLPKLPPLQIQQVVVKPMIDPVLPKPDPGPHCTVNPKTLAQECDGVPVSQPDPGPHCTVNPKTMAKECDGVPVVTQKQKRHKTPAAAQVPAQPTTAEDAVNRGA